MDENKNYETPEEVTEEVDVAVEEALKAVEEASEEVAEETTEEVAANGETVGIERAGEEVNAEVETPQEEDASAEASVPNAYDIPDSNLTPAKKSPVGIIVAVVVALLVVGIGGFFVYDYLYVNKFIGNRYNRMGYVDISGKTVQEMADEMGIELSEFLAQYELPADMPGDTTESAAYYNIPVRMMAQMFGMDFAMMKETLHFPESVTEDTTWGDAEGLVLLKYYVGEENLEAFKSEYGFGEEITADTEWGEVRTVVDSKQRDLRLEQEAAAAEAEKQAEEGTDSEEETGEQADPAEGEVAAE